MEVDLLEPILEENRMCVEYRHVSAYVPAKVTPGGFFTGLELPAFTAKAKAKEKEKLRRVSVQSRSGGDGHILLISTGHGRSCVSADSVRISGPRHKHREQLTGTE